MLDDYIYKTNYGYLTEAEYPDLYSKNIIGMPVTVTTSILESETDNDPYVSGVTATTWKDWGSGTWAPHKTYAWKGTGSSFFNHAQWSGNSEPPTQNWMKTSEITARNTHGAVSEAKNSEAVHASTVYGFDELLPIAQFGNATLNEVRADGFDDRSSITDSHLGWQSYYGGTWSIWDGALKGSKSTAGQAIVHAKKGALDHSHSIIEFDIKFLAGNSNDWMGFHFRVNNTGSAFSGGHYLKITKSGTVSVVNNAGNTLGWGTCSKTMHEWRHIRLVQSNSGRIEIYIDGESLIDVTSSAGLSNKYYGFAIDQGAEVLFDNLRIYPNDAVATSTGYDYDSQLPSSGTNANGVTTHIVHD